MFYKFSNQITSCKSWRAPLEHCREFWPFEEVFALQSDNFQILCFSFKSLTHFVFNLFCQEGCLIIRGCHHSSLLSLSLIRARDWNDEEPFVPTGVEEGQGGHHHCSTNKTSNISSQHENYSVRPSHLSPQQSDRSNSLSPSICPNSKQFDFNLRHILKLIYINYVEFVK